MNKFNAEIVKPKHARIFEIDLIRGIAIVLVIIDHIFFDFNYFASLWANNANFLNSFFYTMGFVSNFYLEHIARIIIRLSVIGMFFLISGVSTSFSRSNFKRAAKMLCFAYALTIGSYIVSAIMNTQLNIDFNVLHAFGFSTLIYALLQKRSNLTLFVVAVIMFLIAFVVWFFDISADTLLLLPLGITPLGYTAMDYFPLIPYSGLFLLGAIIGRVLYPNRESLITKTPQSKLLTPILFMGKHSLFFYLGQQAAFLAVFALVGVILGFWS